VTDAVEVASAADALARDLLARGLPFRYVARGRSMWPAVRDGDHVTVAPLDHSPRVGDVVFAATGGFGLLHRVLWVRRDGAVLLKGDFKAGVDGWVASAAVRGRLSAVERAGRSVPVRRYPPLAASLAVSLIRRVRGR
jgi:hypothetical protein